MSTRARDRRGSILPLFAISLVALMAFVALSIDLGLLALNKTMIQNMADAAALAGARNLNGTSGGNTAQATAAANAVAAANEALDHNTTSTLTVQHGAYHYNAASQTFTAQIPPVAPDNYNLTQATVTMNSWTTGFARVLHLTNFNLTATATAAHRPRDVAIVLDFSGSMNNETDLWNCESYLGSYLNTPNNTDSVYPQWGWYAPSFSPAATLQCSTTNPLVGACNITTSVQGVPALVNDFYSNSRGASAVSAFAAAPTSVTNTTPGGDAPLTALGGSTPALTWLDVTGTTATKYTGYAGFKGYTEGPGYWGKTFFAWPPDPGAAKDWRKKFFFLSNGTTPCNNDLALYDTGGNWLDPPGNYVINYKAILAWIITKPNPFPTQLRAGNVLYYSSIPTDVPASAYDHTQPNSNITDPSQRFWKEYIDFTLGVWRDPFGNIQHPGSSTCSYGPDFQAGNEPIQITGPDVQQPGPTGVFLDKLDNPLRPRHRFWFGPMTMIQYMLDTGITPGTTHDVSMVAAKLGIAGALQDIQNNHPNDTVSLLVFSRPSYNGEPSDVGQFDQPLNSLGRSYTSMINSLWYPPNSGSSDVTPWDANGQLTPSAHGDYCGNTATSYGLMLAYNQFSSNSLLQTQGMGGYGRVGAQKLVILETDGMANVSTSCGTTNSGANNSYYNIGPSYSYSAGSADPGTDAINAATQICASTTGGSGMPGYATPQKPVTIQCIAFGAIFEPTANSAEAAQAVNLLQQISTVGGTVFPSSASDPTNGYKWCIGTLPQRQQLLQQAFTTIMDNSAISVILVQ